jgi:lysyl-tRNA synthetase class 2
VPLSEDLTREKYLKEKWAPYPAMPLNAKTAGRFREISEDGKTVNLLRGPQAQEILLKHKASLLEVLRAGDIIAITEQDEIVLLAPALKDPPFRKFNFEIQKRWSAFVTEVRIFFAMESFLEVRTPSLVSCPGTEPSLDVFSTTLQIGSKQKKLFLPTSPELHLKKLLALGAEKIFEIANCFRNGEVTDIHQPEFLMLEWYRAYQNLDAIKQDVVNFIASLAKELNVDGPKSAKSVSVAQLFKTFCDFDLTLTTTMEELKELALKLRVDVHSAESIDDYFFLIFMDRIENNLPKDELIFVEKYPPYQAALARIDSEGWGERFEVYWKGMELANAFHELNDPKIQRTRFEEDLAKKKAMGKEEIQIDEEFLQFLESGIPPSAGIALGLERLFMALFDIKQIRELRSFPL